MTDEKPLPEVEALARISFVTNARIEEGASRAGLSITQLRLLGILRDREPTINELTVHLGLDKSSVSGLVIRAERRGLVGRTPDDHDGRAIRVHLEPSGRAIIDAASAQFDGDMTQIFSTLSEVERAQWLALTTRLIAAEASAR